MNIVFKNTELYTLKWIFSQLKKGSNSSLKPQAGWLSLRGWTVLVFGSPNSSQGARIPATGSGDLDGGKRATEQTVGSGRTGQR